MDYELRFGQTTEEGWTQVSTDRVKPDWVDASLEERSRTTFYSLLKNDIKDELNLWYQDEHRQAAQNLANQIYGGSGGEGAEERILLSLLQTAIGLIPVYGSLGNTAMNISVEAVKSVRERSGEDSLTLANLVEAFKRDGIDARDSAIGTAKSRLMQFEREEEESGRVSLTRRQAIAYLKDVRSSQPDYESLRKEFVKVWVTSTSQGEDPWMDVPNITDTDSLVEGHFYVEAVMSDDDPSRFVRVRHAFVDDTPRQSGTIDALRNAYEGSPLDRIGLPMVVLLDLYGPAAMGHDAAPDYKFERTTGRGQFELIHKGGQGDPTDAEARQYLAAYLASGQRATVDDLTPD